MKYNEAANLIKHERLNLIKQTSNDPNSIIRDTRLNRYIEALRLAQQTLEEKANGS